MKSNKFKIMLGVAAVTMAGGQVTQARAADIVTGLLAHYSFDDCTAADSVSGLNGTLIGGSLPCVAGVQGKALTFKPGYISLPNLGASWKDGFTMCAWILPKQASSNNFLFEMANGATAQNVNFVMSRFDLGWNYDNYYNQWQDSKAISRGLTNYTLDPGRVVLPLGKWAHWCLTIDNLNPQMKMYVDGLLFGNKVGKIQNIARNFTSLGANFTGASGARFNGLMDEVRIYTRALDAKEVAELRAFESPLMGAVTDGALKDKNLTCSNQTTGQEITQVVEGPNWNCTGAGLKVNPGDNVNVTIGVVGD